VIYLFHGENEFLIQEAVRRIAAGMGPADMVGLNTTQLEGARVSPGELLQACNTIPFLAEARLIVVEGLLKRVEQEAAARARGRAEQGNPGRGRSRPRPAGEDEWAGFPEQVAAMPPTNHLVLVEGRLERATPLRTALSALAQVRHFPVLRNAELAAWAAERAQAAGYAFASGALVRLAALAGDDLRNLASEIEKLGLYAGGRPVTAADVDNLVPGSSETSIFTLVDAVVERQFTTALRAMHSMLEAGAAPQYLLFMLARQFRLVLLARELGRQGVGGSDLMDRLGMRSEFPFRKTVRQASRYTARAVQQALERLLEADVAMKTGRQDPELALELLVADLCRAQAAGRVTSRSGLG
jgi:DNA polymerase-3 subunit delta